MQGGCYCGALRYEVTEKPVHKAQCCCRECQYISGGGPNFFMVIQNEGFVWTKGAAKEFTRSDLERPVTRQFCPDCGTHITTLLKARGLTVLKVGTLDDPERDYGGPKASIFMKDAQPFHLVAEGVPCFEELRPPQ